MRRPVWASVVIHSFLGLTTIVILYPVIFMVLATFTTPEQYYRTSFLPIPNVLDFRNYVPIFTEEAMIPAINITVLRAVWYVLWSVVIGLLGGYVFARLKFPFKNALFLLFLSGLMVPGVLTLLPVYIMLARWPLVGGNDIFGQGGHGFINQMPALFMLGLVNVVSIFLIKQNYEMIPSEYEEAAIVDGAGTFRIIFQIYAPMLRPALTAVAILEFVNIWNDYLGPLVFVGGNKDLTPIALAVQRMIYRYTQWTAAASFAHFPLVFAAATFMSIPTIIVYITFQRYFVQGLVGVGLRG
jgi:multiple sugar transport system permease protein